MTSFERADTGESLVIAINLSSQAFASVVETDRGSDNGRLNGEYRDITPSGLPADSPQSRVSLPAIFLGPWEFRVYSRGPPK